MNYLIDALATIGALSLLGCLFLIYVMIRFGRED